MGSFGYICKGCNTPINGNCFGGGEKCVMIYVRHGEELGRVEAHYDEYGRVSEQDCLPEDEKYRGDHNGINGHSEICTSEFGLDDSYCRLEDFRIFQGREVDYRQYSVAIIQSLCETGLSLDKATKQFLNNEKLYQWKFNALPKIERSIYSGTAAWHSFCYNKATEQERCSLVPSSNDPNQSWGRVRKKYS
ncbi:MAG: hypothetical protein LBI03_05925 [Clostridiales bacterium]|jgi:hypothetical protein|nr:hypothetical protein [Clostridiales bacterium]